MQKSAVQTRPSSQVSLAPGTQILSLQVSPTVQASPSASHGAVLAVDLQPALLSQLSVVHGLSSSQMTLAPALQLPSTQASLLVQTLPSASQAVPSLDLPSKMQLPVVLSQLSLVQTLSSSQVLIPPATQALSLQVSPTVQASPSASHGATFAGWTQPALGSQLSLVHGFHRRSSAQRRACTGLWRRCLQRCRCCRQRRRACSR